ncbi:MAG TPA: hypothetical protein QF646_01520 [Candidatus Poseidoniales archaeon]|nr:hypothetical protein [Candidatus Poseidoniales archaeon]
MRQYGEQRRFWHIILIVTTLLISIGTASGTQVTEVASSATNHSGGILGGIERLANMSFNESVNLSELGQVIEAYTAVWCTNCVKTEHSMDDALADKDVVRVHVHNTTNDPFGTEAGDERWGERYGDATAADPASGGRYRMIAPTAIVGGSWMHLGTRAEVLDDLSDEFNVSLTTASNWSPHGEIELQWDVTANSTGTLTYKLSIDAAPAGGSECDIEGATLIVAGDCATHSVRVRAVAVEDMIYYDGSNGQSSYPHVARSWYDLGEGLTGTKDLSLPEAWDGQDIHLVLFIEWTDHSTPDKYPPDSIGGTDAECAPGDSKPSDDGCNMCACLDGLWACTEMGCVETPEESIPTVSFVATLSLLVLATTTHAKAQASKHPHRED